MIKISWSEYLVCKNKKIALEIGRNHNREDIDYQEINGFHDVIEYLNETSYDEYKSDVISYLWKRAGFPSDIQTLIINILTFYGKYEWKVISDNHDDYDILEKENYTMLNFLGDIDGEES